ncbi:MAG: L-threonylcarbamoyladenylate synthase, partial [Wenzhouxiangellaceae bacterium]
VPNHPVALALLREFGGALAAPSANRFGRISPTTAAHVETEFGDEVAAVIDGGACLVGVESTIVDVTGPRPRLLRPGMILEDAIEAILDVELEVAGDHQGPRASGRLESHYAPDAPVELVTHEHLTGRLDDCAEQGLGVAVLARRDSLLDHLHDVMWIRMPDHPVQYARVLYAELRNADQVRPDRILVELPPHTPAWTAIHDRLRRAASG